MSKNQLFLVSYKCDFSDDFVDLIVACKSAREALDEFEKSWADGLWLPGGVDYPVMICCSVISEGWLKASSNGQK